jgi:hypothetical protein
MLSHLKLFQNDFPEKVVRPHTDRAIAMILTNLERLPCDNGQRHTLILLSPPMQGSLVLTAGNMPRVIHLAFPRVLPDCWIYETGIVSLPD